MTDVRRVAGSGLARLSTALDPEIVAAARLFEDAVRDILAPLNRVEGRAKIAREPLMPLRMALTGVQRRDGIVIGGETPRDFAQDGSAIGHLPRPGQQHYPPDDPSRCAKGPVGLSHRGAKSDRSQTAAAMDRRIDQGSHPAGAADEGRPTFR
ncbi:MAG: hypothetical protein WBA67_16560 [Jannaschia sp.]